VMKELEVPLVRQPSRWSLGEAAGIRLKRQREETAEALARPYNKDTYDYKELSKSFHEVRKINGLTTTKENGGKIPFTEKMYLESIRYIGYFLCSYVSIKTFEIYLLAMMGEADTENLQFGNSVLDFLLVPASRIIFNSTYHFLNEAVVDPLIVLTSCLIYYYIMKIMELKIELELRSNNHSGYMLGAELIHIRNVSAEDIAKEIEMIMGRKPELRITLVYNSMEIDKYLENYLTKLVELKARIFAKGEASELLSSEVKELRDKVNKRQAAIASNHRGLRKDSVLITFFSYVDNFEFFTKANKYDRKPGSIFYSFEAEEDIHFPPDPHDIDWNYYAQSPTFDRQLFDFGVRVLFFMALPVLTYFLHYTFCTELVKAVTVTTQDVVLEHTFLFSVTRLVVSNIYSQLCSFLIDFYYKNSSFKSHSRRIESKFYFYNLYFMLNHVVADFYATMSAGLGVALIGTESTNNLVKNHQAYIFSAVIKVALMLVLSPLIQLLVAFFQKIKASLMIKYRPSKCTMLDAVTADLPAQHDLGNTASFLIQSVFFISFFQGFMMPIVHWIVLLGIILFYFLERYFISSVYSLRIGMSITNTSMVYRLFIWAFVIGQGLSVSNASMIIAYFQRLDFLSLSSMLTRVLEYGFTVVTISFAVWMNLRYRDRSIKLRVLQFLAQGGDKPGMFESQREQFENKYKHRNPFFKAKRQQYTV